MYAKRMICLANSRKTSGRCIAGKIIDQSGEIGEWIRPVSARNTQEISEEERRYENGEDPRLLEIVTVPFAQPQPHAHQSENHLIDDGYYWKKSGTCSWEQLEAALDSPDSLWDTGFSSYNGLNDRVPKDTAEELDHSLLLIRPEDFVIEVATEGAAFGNPKRKVRARFRYEGDDYRWAVTDPVIEREYLRRENGEYELDDVILCVSLGEAWEGYCYKFCAAVITPARAR